MISNVMLADSGNYTNTLHNMFNNQSFTNNHTISLQVLREWTKCHQTLFIIILILSSPTAEWVDTALILTV